MITRRALSAMPSRASAIRSVRAPVCILAAVLIAAAAASCSRAPARIHVPGADERARPPLIVLVSMDTLRADHLELYGYARRTAPHLTALAGDGLVFETVAAQSTQTLISHKSLLTSLYPLRILHEQTEADLKDLAGLDEPGRTILKAFRKAGGSLVSSLDAAGYRTAGFTDGGWMSSRLRFGDGFGHFDEEGGGFAKIVPRAIRWLEAAKPTRAQPVFVFVHGYDIHCPYKSRAPYDTKFCRNHAAHVDLAGKCGKPDLMSMDLTPADLRAITDHYDGGIASADAWLGVLLDRLRFSGLYDESMIVVFGDHGESLGERGLIGHSGLYLEQLMVPLVVKLPASWAVGPARVSAAAELVDVMPTILDAAGAAPPKGLDGESLLPVAAGRRPGRSYLTAQIAWREAPDAPARPAKRAILEPGRWLVVADGATGKVDAFNLSLDPAALRDLGTDPPAPARDLLAAMQLRDMAMLGQGTHAAPTALNGRPVEEQLDAKTLERLRSLGYLD